MTPGKKPQLRWLKILVVMLLGSLIYAVYFTELGKPEPIENERQIRMYGQTAAPTLFVKWQTVPTVELDWAYASRNLLKFSVVIHDLEVTIDPEEWICNPRITMDRPVPRRLRSYEMRIVYGTSGETIQATYEYEIVAGGRDSLALEMDITIGPCADYLNFQESNVTPSFIPELVGNYHLSFQVPVTGANPSPSLTPAGVLDMWRDLPIFPGGIESNDFTADLPVYRYIVEEATVDAVRRFYEDRMQETKWESLAAMNVGAMDIGKAYTLYFTRGQELAVIDIYSKDQVVNVFLHFE